MTGKTGPDKCLPDWLLLLGTLCFSNLPTFAFPHENGNTTFCFVPKKGPYLVSFSSHLSKQIPVMKKCEVNDTILIGV